MNLQQRVNQRKLQKQLNELYDVPTIQQSGQTVCDTDTFPSQGLSIDPPTDPDHPEQEADLFCDMQCTLDMFCQMLSTCQGEQYDQIRDLAGQLSAALTTHTGSYNQQSVSSLASVSSDPASPVSQLVNTVRESLDMGDDDGHVD